MIRFHLSPFFLPAVLVLGASSGCGGGGGSKPEPLSLSGRNADGLSISFSQQSASISSGQAHRYTVTLRNDTSQVRDIFALTDAQGLFPADIIVSDASDHEVFDSFEESTTLTSTELKPNQVLTRTVVVPASALAQPGTYRARAFFVNKIADGPADILESLEVRVR